MTYPLALPQKKANPRHGVLEAFMSGWECDAAITLAMKQPETQGTISVANMTDENVRKSRLRWCYWNTESDWLFQKLGQAVRLLNAQLFQFDLVGIPEIQFTEYHAPDGKYEFHQDLGEESMSLRKLSLTVQLSEPTDYEGGEFEIFALGQTMPKTRGTVLAFPSYEQHRVTPVTKGVRRSLVVWVSGPPFR